MCPCEDSVLSCECAAKSSVEALEFWRGLEHGSFKESCRKGAMPVQERSHDVYNHQLPLEQAASPFGIHILSQIAPGSRLGSMASNVCLPRFCFSLLPLCCPICTFFGMGMFYLYHFVCKVFKFLSIYTGSNILVLL